MKLKNRFSQWVRWVFSDTQPCCQKCGSNQMLEIHHIYGTISSALFNGIVLCHKCHAVADSFNRITGIKGTKVRQDLLFLTLTALYRNRYYIDTMPKIEQKRVKEFIGLVKDDIKVVLKNIC